MKYLRRILSAAVPPSDPGWWGKYLAGATYYWIGCAIIGLDFRQSNGVLFFIIAASIWASQKEVK